MTSSNSSSSKVSSYNSSSPKTSTAAVVAAATGHSTAKTSLDSILKERGPNTRYRKRKIRPLPFRAAPVDHHNADAGNSNNNHNDNENDAARPSRGQEHHGLALLTPIQEMPPVRPNKRPTIVTVERAAAARIYLETHFNRLLLGASPRQVRRQLLEADLFHRARALENKRRRRTRSRSGDGGGGGGGGGGAHALLDAAEVDAARSRFCRRESEYLREMRVLKARCLKALLLGEGGGAGKEAYLTSGYEPVKVLGRGSFGVVSLVRERRTGEVYAMKVIRKSRMLQASQEGHLWAERDMLVASEGSRW